MLSIGGEQAKVEVHAHDKHTPHSPLATIHAGTAPGPAQFGRRAVAPAAESNPTGAAAASGPQHGRRAVGAGKP